MQPRFVPQPERWPLAGYVELENQHDYLDYQGRHVETVSTISIKEARIGIEQHLLERVRAEARKDAATFPLDPEAPADRRWGSRNWDRRSPHLFLLVAREVERRLLAGTSATPRDMAAAVLRELAVELPPVMVSNLEGDLVDALQDSRKRLHASLRQRYGITLYLEPGEAHQWQLLTT